jgi:putative addiction module antidote
MLTLTVTAVGEALGLILSKEAIAMLKVQKGDTLLLTDAPDGALRIAPYHPDFQAQMTLAEQLQRDDRDILRALATNRSEADSH